MKNNGQTTENDRDSGVLSNALSFIRSGVCAWDNNGLYDHGAAGYYWSLRSANTTVSTYLYFSNTSLNPQYNSTRGYGIAVRCVDKSFTTLINTSYSMKSGGEAPEANSKDSGVLSSPLSFIHSGCFSWHYAGLDLRNSIGTFWSLISHDTASSGGLYFYSTNLYSQASSYRGIGFAVRHSESFTTLINTSYSMKNWDQTSETSQDSGVLSDPLSFPRSGRFDWGGAGLNSRGGGGYYWSLRSATINSSNNLDHYDTYLVPQNGYNHGYGFAVCCISLAPDSICPKGWQLPTYSGDKSFTNLINTSYSMKNEGEARDSGVLSSPLSFLRSGSFYWYNAGLNSRGGYGGYWSLRSAGTTSSDSLRFYNTYLSPQYSNDRGNGFAVRCVSEVLSLNLTILGICDIIKRYGFVNSSCWTRGTDRD